MKNIRSVYVSDIQTLVRNDTIVKFRVNVKISFIIGG